MSIPIKTCCQLVLFGDLIAVVSETIEVRKTKFSYKYIVQCTSIEDNHYIALFCNEIVCVLLRRQVGRLQLS